MRAAVSSPPKSTFVITTHCVPPSTAVVEQLGRLDVIVANAGIGTAAGKLHKTDETVWQEMIDVNLSGVWKTVKAGRPAHPGG